MDINRIKDKLRPVLQYDLNNNFIKEWKSLTDVNKILKISIGNIWRVLNNQRNQAGGYIWRYKRGESHVDN